MNPRRLLFSEQKTCVEYILYPFSIYPVQIIQSTPAGIEQKKEG